jgi:hypothetical protein
MSRGRGRDGGAQTKQITWVVCLVLYLFALAAHFGIIHVQSELATWAWILGYGLLLIAGKLRGL